MKRSSGRLNQIRQLPCIRCGSPAPSEACHANWAEFGKSMGKKALDEYTIALCRVCHAKLDQYKLGNREESKRLFERWLEQTNRLLSADDDEVF